MIGGSEDYIFLIVGGQEVALCSILKLGLLNPCQRAKQALGWDRNKKLVGQPRT